jgi:hypothetical protein
MCGAPSAEKKGEGEKCMRRVRKMHVQEKAGREKNSSVRKKVGGQKKKKLLYMNMCASGVFCDRYLARTVEKNGREAICGCVCVSRSSRDLAHRDGT